MKKQSGFTLIELIVVIVILGILAATALPRFANLQGDARLASVQAAQGALNSAAVIAHSTFLARNTAANGVVAIEGVNATNKNGYPAVAEMAALAGLDAANYAFANPTATSIQVSPVGAPVGCNVTWAEPAIAGNAPTVTLNATAANCQ